MARAIAFLILLLISPAAYAATHNVGDSSGWNLGVNYDNWVRGKTFAVGDTLVFTYDSSHAVDEVRQADYQNCNTGNAISTNTSSPTTISLPTAGTRYFLCPRSNHCSQGMKLAVTVSGGSGSPPSGGGGNSPPSETPGTPPSTTVPPPPPAGGATSILGGRSSLMVGVSVVLGALLGLMG